MYIYGGRISLIINVKSWKIASKNPPWKAGIPKTFPIPPDRISEEKLQLILDRELTEWRVARSALPENPFVEREELYRNSSLDKHELLKKIFPIRVEALNFSGADGQKPYYTYWKEQEEKWEEMVSEFGADQQKYRNIQAIRFSLTELLPFLSDINSMTDEVLSKNDLAEIKQSIRERVLIHS